MKAQETGVIAQTFKDFIHEAASLADANDRYRGNTSIDARDLRSVLQSTPGDSLERSGEFFGAAYHAAAYAVVPDIMLGAAATIADACLNQGESINFVDAAGAAILVTFAELADFVNGAVVAAVMAGAGVYSFGKALAHQ